MIRRLAVAAAAIAAVVTIAALSSCATFEHNDAAAVVNGRELSHDDLQAMITSDMAQALTGESPFEDTYDAATAASIISRWISRHALIDAGISASVDRAEISGQFEEQYGAMWTGCAAPMRALLIDIVAVNQALEDGEATADEASKIVAGADIQVDSRYGTWDAESAAIAPLGA